jgi:malic enzyme
MCFNLSCCGSVTYFLQISTAKSAIYTLVGGLDPAKTLSVVLDVGTNNDKLLNDPLYVVSVVLVKRYRTS